MTLQVMTAPAPERRVSGDPLELLLKGTYPDPQTGAAVGVRTRGLVIADSLAGMEAGLVADLGFGKRLTLVSDPTTHGVLGVRVEAALAGRYAVQSLVLPADVVPDDATVARLRAASGLADAFIAVGSGTINDLVKYASALERKPYAVFGTAPSMNGYVSLTASITVGGHKSTLPAQAPAGAFFDIGVLAAAPPRMIRAGLGDSLCRTTAQADWLLSHLLFDTPYRELPFALLAADEPQLFDRAGELLGGSLEAMRILARTLVLSGFGTAIVGSSAPASQGEHLVSHYIDMLEPPGRPPVFHGEQVGVTTLSLARLQHAMLDVRPVVHLDIENEPSIRRRFGDELGGSVWEEFSQKRLDRAGAEALNRRIAAGWDAIREKIAAVLLPVGRMEAVLAAAGAPMIPADIHLERGFYQSALRHGREIRNRYTMLDLAAASGRLESSLVTI
ncbi:MAG: iron-containing alcohol dehydrogenase [Devosia nanyangense]|uniref:Iron-containing alcohol dehydrogenase n=1 Tax=Devosia nanyangense TaxID=1228055 RepID=A0A933L5L6_9HYPH|nr:iron-containing alcohol dehydrogenase [Devosia nanyangense]